MIFLNSKSPKSAATQAGDRNALGRCCDLADVALPSGIFLDTIGRLFLNLCTVFFTNFHSILGLSSKTHCFNVARLGASSLLWIKASLLFCNFFIRAMFPGPTKKKLYNYLEINLMITYYQGWILPLHCSSCVCRTPNFKQV